MKLTIEGTKDEVVALVRELGENEMLLTNADGLVDLEERPDYEKERRRRDLQAWATTTPTDDPPPGRSVTVTMNNAPQAHKEGGGE